ncbi:MAG TPA: EamA family transporter, partial [Hyphomicrobiaceae bacterium]|nr:EamA family transporter [Hyphomicrobiaceae bacterium]
AVLVAAACHAGWNALLKMKVAPVVATVLVAVASGVLVVPLLAITPAPAPAAWPYVLASVLIHVVYFVTLAEAYRWGDLTQVYPIARGTAPLLTAALATLWLNEALGLAGWAGMIVLATGILLLTFKGGRPFATFAGRAVGFALATSLTITAYTLVDGIGARLAGSALAYTVWLFIGDGIAMAIYGWLRVGPSLVGDFKTHWRMALAGAALSTAAYAIAIWAMTVAPIALVAALRETSVLFAAVFGTVLLREPILPIRLVAAGLVLAGALLLRVR